MIPDKKHNPVDLISQFISAAERIETTVEQIQATPENLKQAIQRAIKGEERVVLAEPDDLATALFEPLRQIPGIVSHPDDEQLAAAQIGITDAFAGIARTGSVCVAMTRKLGGSVSLFSRCHIAILDARSIVARPRDLFLNDEFREKALKRNFVFITGSSATADMGSLVRGVHGPGKLHVIILKK
jgi:L-lactate dehydrogenase complex protein LldG